MKETDKAVTDSGKAPSVEQIRVERKLVNLNGKWLIGFDFSGEAMWTDNIQRAGEFVPSEIKIANVEFRNAY